MSIFIDMHVAQFYQQGKVKAVLPMWQVLQGQRRGANKAIVTRSWPLFQQSKHGKLGVVLPTRQAW